MRKTFSLAQLSLISGALIVLPACFNNDVSRSVSSGNGNSAGYGNYSAPSTPGTNSAQLGGYGTIQIAGLTNACGTEDNAFQCETMNDAIGVCSDISGDHTGFDINSVSPASLCGSKGNNADFSDANFEGGDLRGINLYNGDFDDANLTSSVMDYAKLTRGYFRTTLGQSLSARHAQFEGINFYQANLSHSDFSDTLFMSYQTSRVVFTHAKLEGVNFRNTRMKGHGPSIERLSLYGTLLKGANLRSADLLHVDLRGANLEGADLSNAVLQRYLPGAGGGGIILTPSEDDFLPSVGANNDTSFKNAKLCNADLRGLNVTSGVDFSGAIKSAGTKLPAGLSAAQLDSMKDAANGMNCTATAVIQFH